MIYGDLHEGCRYVALSCLLGVVVFFIPERARRHRAVGLDPCRGFCSFAYHAIGDIFALMGHQARQTILWQNRVFQTDRTRSLASPRHFIANAIALQ